MRLPRLTGREVIRALKRLGFEELRIKGSHYYLVHHLDPSRRATVPVHANRVLHTAILGSILRTAKVTRQDLTAQL